MNGLEIYNHRGKLIEKWVLHNGVAMPEQINNKDGKPLYPKTGSVGPEDGVEYLRRLEDVVSRSTMIYANKIYMNGLEIYTDQGRLIEKWTLHDGVAMPEQLNDKGGGPLYPKCDGIGPEDGIEYLRRLEDVVSRATMIYAKKI